MDHNLNAHVKLDIAADVVRIDVRGSLTQASRPFLLQIIQRVRHMGISSHIRVDLGRAGFVESVALAGLRNDLNSIDGGAPRPDVAGAVAAATGVSLDLNPDREDPAAVLRSIDISGDFTASLDSSGTRTLTGFTDDELLAASDVVFGRLDDPADMASSELLASYDEISLEISRREVGREPEPA